MNIEKLKLDIKAAGERIREIKKAFRHVTKRQMRSPTFARSRKVISVPGRNATAAELSELSALKSKVTMLCTLRSIGRGRRWHSSTFCNPDGLRKLAQIWETYVSENLSPIHTVTLVVTA